ncbi:sulfide-dependent adenosine diphosphate thiazole synthase [Methanoregula formicica]|uniref:Thiamine thiazole synthase n=1 Tax=Methanoregula formicica (strain DSM 22288 / NBRC 105244 / SMSP) TaxID=593750 RepID=L0HE00_METFS|nr:sulfide-dependent adenosine diphosphate thiazole synthase [Methanoregula formicica]AGB01319.1 thiazole biosynthesis enzyme [Methanoregula formicica SMSP]
MELDELTISRAILASQTNVLINHLELDAAVVGGGPAGLTCAALIAGQGKKVGVIEKKLSVGGGMWGGGMMFPRIVVQEEARRLLDLFGIRYTPFESGYYVARSVEAVSKLTAAACDAGVEFFNLMSVEDVMIKADKRISGLVINWTAVEMGKLHVDPLVMGSRYTVDATGHDAVVARLVEKKGGDIRVKGEGFMWADRAETNILNHTKEIFPGLVVAGMAANAVAGESRMGPVFGGMFLSGERAAQIVLREMKA